MGQALWEGRQDNINSFTSKDLQPPSPKSGAKLMGKVSLACPACGYFSLGFCYSSQICYADRLSSDFVLYCFTLLRAGIRSAHN